VYVQGINDAILFYAPVKKILASRHSYAAVYQSQARILQIFLPATTKVVRRERKGAAHLHDPADPISSLPNQPGPYLYDLSQPFVVGAISSTLTQNLDSTMPRIVHLASANQFPDQQGHFILGYGTSHQEGPIPYIARPSSTTLLISPTYTVQKEHPSGTDVSIIAQRNSVNIDPAGSDYAFYITGVVEGRIYAQDLINQVTATGISIVYTILYPNSVGLGKSGTQYDEITYVYGE
jgi:hypothetical protein